MIEASSIVNLQNLNIYKKVENSDKTNAQPCCPVVPRKEIKDEAMISDEAKQLNKADKEKELTTQEKRKVEELKARDVEVKAHEQAHMAAAAGIITQGAHYKYEKGPDGEKYAVSGEVNINLSKEKDPEKTIKKAEQIKKAALAPSEPSSQDQKVAQKADQMINEARAELSKKEENQS